MDAIFNKVSTIFKERYGAELKIDKKLTVTQKRQEKRSSFKSPFVYSRTLRQVSFPIFNSKQELNAVVTARPVDNKDAIIFAEMAQFLQLTIAEHISLIDELETQDQTLIAIERAHCDDNKVIELRTKKDSVPHYQYKDFKKKKPLDRRPIWISGDNDNFNSHIAFSVHDWIGNWAFINAKETPDLVWEDAHSWQNFPQVTLFVPNIEELTSDQIRILRENLAKLQKMDGPKPLIIVTSQNEVSEELEQLKREFKNYRSNAKISARVQAHFLIYHHKQESPFLHECDETKGIYFLPFSPGSHILH